MNKLSRLPVVLLVATGAGAQTLVRDINGGSDVGRELFAQAVVVDPAGGFFGLLSLSNGLRIVVGEP